MKKLPVMIPLICLLCFVVGCERGQEVDERDRVTPLSDEDVAAIRALGPAINEASLTGDLDAIFEMYTEDLLLLPPNTPAIRGRAAFREWLLTMGVEFAEADYQFGEIKGYGDIAYATATYTETFNLDGVEEPVHDEGKVLTILRKQPDGTWLFSIWMWASDLPVTE